MTPKKKAITIQEAGTSSQVPQRTSWTSWTSTNVRNWGNIPNPIGLTHPEHVSRYNILSSKLVVAIRYYDKDLLTGLGLLDDIC